MKLGTVLLPLWIVFAFGESSAEAVPGPALRAAAEPTVAHASPLKGHGFRQETLSFERLASPAAGANARLRLLDASPVWSPGSEPSSSEPARLATRFRRAELVRLDFSGALAAAIAGVLSGRGTALPPPAGRSH